MVHCGHDHGSVEQQARNARPENRTKSAGYLAATRFAEDTIREQQASGSNKPCIGGLHHFLEAALFGSSLQGTGGLADIDDLLQPFILVSAAMHESHEQ